MKYNLQQIVRLTVLIAIMLPLNSLCQKDTRGLDSTVVTQSDSLVKNYLKSLTKSYAVKNPFDSIENPVDPDKFIDKLKDIRPQGVITLGHDYGLLTGYINPSSTRPLNVYRTEGNLSVNALGLPLNVSYNYSTFRNPLGVNNFFRISLDTERMKQQAEKKKKEMIGELDNKIDDVQNGKHELSGKMGYAEVLKQKLEAEALNYKKDLTKYEQQLKDSIPSKNIDSDSLNTSSAKRDSLQKKYNDSKQAYDKATQLYDTINKAYSTIKKLYETYTEWEEKLTTNKERVEGYSGMFSKDGLKEIAEDSLSNRKESFLGCIKTFDIGLTYPKSSALSSNSVPVKGINLEIQRKKWYSSFSAGIMMNNLMVSNDIVQNKLFNSKNSFNQFDFQSVTHQGFLVSVKSGYGTVEGDHAFLGLRYLTNSKLPNQNIEPSNNTLVPSIGLELDTRITPKFLPLTTIDAVYGKTSDSQKLADSTRQNPFSSLFSGDRTHTGLLKVSQPVAKIRSVFIGSMRWIDPHADVRSLGVLQPNNVRYELKSNHSITSRFKVGLNFRKDRNNVDNRSDTTIHLVVIGGNLNGKIGKRISYFGSLNYLIQSNINDKSIVSRNKNYMYGAGITAQYKIMDINNSVSFNYNDYLLTDTSSTSLMRNIGIQNMTLFEAGQNTFSLNYFKSTSENLGNNSTTIISDEVSVKRKKLKYTIGLTMAFNSQLGNDVGGKVEVTAKLAKFLIMNVKAEKLVLGNFYNSYNRNLFNKFPYAITTNFNFIIN